MYKHTLFCMLTAAFFTSTFASTTRFKGFNFETYAISDLGYRYCELQKAGGTWIQIEKEDAYSLVINNPLPVRVAVAVAIDGLNVIDGKRTTPDKAQKWIIEANSSITLRGWQTDRSSLRRFVFTDKSDSYAKWKGDRDRKPYTRNLGVIGVAYFWNSAELYAIQHPPRPFENRSGVCPRKKSAGTPAASRPMDECAPEKEQAGTGMREHENNNVIDVEFRYDTGMYREKDALTIYYEFARNTDRPHPFSDETDRANFTPEMP